MAHMVRCVATIMRSFRFITPLALTALVWVGLLRAEPPLPQGALEKRALFSPEEIKDWWAAECSVEPSAKHAKDAAQSLHWQVKVDYHAGEKAYPIGWPRTGRRFAPAMQDWSEWDYLRAWIYADTSRAALPREPAGLGVRFSGGLQDFNLRLTDLKKGVWTELLIPLSKLPGTKGVESMQFNISEQNYAHGDTLDFYVSDLALLRHTEPTLLAFTPERTVMYADAALLPVVVHLAGVKSGETRELTCELRRGGKVVARLTVPITRGPQRLALSLDGKHPAPGDYELAATVAGNPAAVTAKLRLVESPWK